MTQLPLLSMLIWLPLLGAVVVGLTPTRRAAECNRARFIAMGFAVATLVISLLVWANYDPGFPGYQFREDRAVLPLPSLSAGKFQILWAPIFEIPAFGISYALGIDGISLFLVVLSAFLMPIVVLGSFSVKKSVRGYLAAMLVLESAMMGTLLALDLFLFYIFWEFMLAPMYFIIGIWGGQRRIYASLKFVLYTVAGSVLMFLAMFFVVWRYTKEFGVEPSFLLENLLRVSLSPGEQVILFGAFAVAFGVKVPIFPFHTWLPDAHVEAPTGGSVILAGVLLKMGIYGFIRFAYPLFPQAAMQLSFLMAVLGVTGIVYGALVAWVQTDIKKLVAYSSVSHLGYCVLGLAALNQMGTTGSIYQMLNHGISTSALFLLVGVLYDRKHTRRIADYSGLAGKVPLFATLFLLFTLSSIALPLTNGFVGEFLILVGSFIKFPMLTLIAVLGVILGAVYMLTLYLKTMFGELNADKNGDLRDVNFRELAMFVPLLVLVFVMGVYPEPFLRVIRPSVDRYVGLVEGRAKMLEERPFLMGKAEASVAGKDLSATSDDGEALLLGSRGKSPVAL